MLEIILYEVNHRHWHFVVDIDVNQTDCTFQVYKFYSEISCILRGRIDNGSVVFFKSMGI